MPCATTASPPDTPLLTALLFIPGGQPSGPRSPRLAQGPPQPAHRRSAETLTVADAPVTTALVGTPALPQAVPAHIQPSRAQTDEPLHANPSLLISHMPSTTFHVPPLPPNPPLPLTHALSFTPTPCTPIHHTLLASLLSLHPNPTWVTYLLDGLTHDFRVGYCGGHSARTAPNLRSALARPQVIHQYLAAECEARHTVGPFPSPPLPAFVVNPLDAVPKKRSGKWRLIMHLSHPPGESVNDGIEVTDFPLRYSTVYYAIDSVMQLGQGGQMAKIDIKSAFRLCPVHPADHHLLGMRWRGRFYFNRVLPFGLRSAPFIFNCLADAIGWIATQHGIHPIHHYLDDFFLAGTPSSPHCLHNLQSLISLCNDLGVPLAEDKVDGPSMQLEYLRILLDSLALEARLSPERLLEIHQSLSTWSTRTHCRKQELLSLIGTLSFAAKVVPAGSTFLRRMIDTATTVPSLQDDIQLSESFRLDFEWWQAFATPWNGRSFFLRPGWTPSPDLELYTDSSGSIGYGAYCQGSWFNGHWSQEQLHHSIQWKELYPIVLAVCV